MILAHKIRLNPTPEQERYFYQACNASRLAWNWGLAEWKRQYEAGEKPTAFKLKKQFNSIKREQYPWVCEVTKSAVEQPFLNLQKAFKNFFKNPSHFGYPRFKKKGKSKLSFYLSNDQFRIDGLKVKIPKMNKYTGVKKLWWVDMSEQLRFDGKVMGSTISCEASMWYMTITVEVAEINNTHPQGGESVGIDLGIEKLATLSTGEIYENIRSIKKNQKRLSGLSRQLAKCEKGSNRWEKTKKKIQKVHKKIADQRRDHIHKMTHGITSNYEFVVLEDLNVSGMLKNRKLSKAISEASFGEIVRQIEYKSQLFNGQVVKIDRFFPSSKLCSACGAKNDYLKLSDRTYKCCECGLKIDRDLNAALNILHEGLK